MTERMVGAKMVMLCDDASHNARESANHGCAHAV